MDTHVFNESLVRHQKLWPKRHLLSTVVANNIQIGYLHTTNQQYVVVGPHTNTSIVTCIHIHIYIYLGLGSYRLTIKERNDGVGIRGKNRVVDESTPCVANMNCEGFYYGETELL
jgi:hypothetical protein